MTGLLINHTTLACLDMHQIADQSDFAALCVTEVGARRELKVEQ
jgi:hypothetical protein